MTRSDLIALELLLRRATSAVIAELGGGMDSHGRRIDSLDKRLATLPSILAKASEIVGRVETAETTTNAPGGDH